MARTKTNTQNNTQKNVERQDATYNQHNTMFCVFRIFLSFIYNFLNDFSKKCWVTALVRSMNFIGGLNQFLAIKQT